LKELVNLIALGRAASNVFDDEYTLGEGQDVKVLKGIKRPCQFGHLSLYEHYNSLQVRPLFAIQSIIVFNRISLCKQVGERLKNPTYPIFIVCSESHYTVLFAKQHLISPQSSFDMFYYDGLANQDNEIKLTISK
jgi:hypothetical protein